MFCAKLIEPPINDFESNKVMVVLIDNFMLNLHFPLKSYYFMHVRTYLITYMCGPWKLNPFLPFKCPGLL
jgi:hypothetical protein